MIMAHPNYDESKNNDMGAYARVLDFNSTLFFIF